MSEKRKLAPSVASQTGDLTDTDLGKKLPWIGVAQLECFPANCKAHLYHKLASVPLLDSCVDALDMRVE
eukprot:19605-Pleurochrysis_carterae.AAC.1